MTEAVHALPVPTLQASPAIAVAPKPTADLRGALAYLVPQRTRWIVVVVAATASLVATVGIPILARAVIDGPLRNQDQGGLWALGLTAMALGLSEAAMLLIRRWFIAHATMGLDGDMRRALHPRVQLLPMSFHQRGQSQHLESRIANIPGAIRDLLSFRAIFAMFNVLQIAVLTGCLLVLCWPLGLVVLASILPSIASRWHCRREFTHQPGAVQDEVSVAAQFWTILDVIPNLALIMLLGCGAFAVSNGLVTNGTVAAFAMMTLSLVWPVTAIGPPAFEDQLATMAAGQGIEIFGTSREIAHGTAVPDTCCGRME